MSHDHNNNYYLHHWSISFFQQSLQRLERRLPTFIITREICVGLVCIRCSASKIYTLTLQVLPHKMTSTHLLSRRSNFST